MRTVGINGRLYLVPGYVTRQHRDGRWKISLAGIAQTWDDSVSGAAAGLAQCCHAVLKIKKGDSDFAKSLCSAVVHKSNGSWSVDLPFGLTNDQTINRAFLEPICRESAKSVLHIRLNSPSCYDYFTRVSVDNALNGWVSKLQYALTKVDAADYEEAIRAATGSEPELVSEPSTQTSLF